MQYYHYAKTKESSHDVINITHCAALSLTKAKESFHKVTGIMQRNNYNCSDIAEQKTKQKTIPGCHNRPKPTISFRST